MLRGRLLKKAEQDKLEALQVEEYPWKNLTPEVRLSGDNPRNNVVLAKTHSESELQEKVHTASEFSRSFAAPVKPNLPQDLTAEFLAGQEELRLRKIRQQMDEEDVVVLELQDHKRQEQQQKQQSSQGQDHQQKKSVASETVQAAAPAPAAAISGQPRAAGPDISDLSSLTPNRNSLGARGIDFGLPEITQETLDSEVKSAFERGLAQGRQDGDLSGYRRGLQEGAASVAPNVESDVNDTAIAAEAERRYSEGLEAGLEQGRLEAARDAEQKYNHSMELFTKALSELQHLKGELLSTGRDIFAEIAQMCAEKILRRRVQWNEDALRSVFTAAMSQFQSNDDLKVEMHPEDIARLERQIPETQRTRLRLVGNLKLERGDIKIEANNEVVSFDIQKSIASVIDSLKDELFEDAKKAESDEEAV